MQYSDLPMNVQNKIQQALKGYWTRGYDIDELGDYYSSSGMRYGYIAINTKTHEVLVCDSTPDDGDTLISVIRF